MAEHSIIWRLQGRFLLPISCSPHRALATKLFIWKRSTIDIFYMSPTPNQDYSTVH